MNNLIGKVLTKDLFKAQRLNDCCIYCLHQARNAYIDGKFKEADTLIKDYRNSKRDLDILMQQKEEHDRIRDLVSSLQGKGINITIVQNLVVKGQGR